MWFDTESRCENLLREFYCSIFQKASSIGDVITVEDEIDHVFAPVAVAGGTDLVVTRIVYNV
jgi:hypothetical protein